MLLQKTDAYGALLNYSAKKGEDNGSCWRTQVLPRKAREADKIKRKKKVEKLGLEITPC